MAAIIATACLFTFEHTQYQIPNMYNAGMILGLFLSAVGFGVVFAGTRSLFPAIIAHMIFDIPMTPVWQGLLVIVLIISSLFIWRRGLDISRKVFSTREHVAYWVLALSGAACALAGTHIRGLEYVGVGMVVLAVALEFLDLRSRRTTTEPTMVTSPE